MGATERVKQYLDTKGISKYKFYQKTGFSNKFLDNSSNMGTDRAEIILRYYPDINPEWLITGNGNMLREESAPAPAQQPQSVIDKECLHCKDKDKIIKLLEDKVEALTFRLQQPNLLHNIQLLLQNPNPN